MTGSLSPKIDELLAGAEMNAVAVGMYDYQSRAEFFREADRPFHAASTIKLAILLSVMRAAQENRLKLESRLHIRNRFKSVADSTIYRVDASRDADPGLHKRVGRAATIAELSRLMITRSSNLATNLLVDYVGVDAIRGTLTDAGVDGIDFRRGVEDERAFASDINNRVTVRGLVRLLRLFCEEGFLSEQAREQALEILFSQEFRSMIPAKLPDEAKVAHKTGEISTACHDAGIVFTPGRKPYVFVALTEFRGDSDRAKKLIADISAAVYERLINGGKS